MNYIFDINNDISTRKYSEKITSTNPSYLVIEGEANAQRYNARYDQIISPLFPKIPHIPSIVYYNATNRLM